MIALVVGISAGLLLLAAAGMKAWQMLEQPAATPVAAEWLAPLAPFLVVFEFVLGLWLISGIRWPWARLAGLACFALFAGLSDARRRRGSLVRVLRRCAD